MIYENEAEDAELKLIDFGFACEIDSGREAMWDQLGTPSYMAPELWSSRPEYDSSVDMCADQSRTAELDRCQHMMPQAHMTRTAPAMCSAWAAGISELGTRRPSQLPPLLPHAFARSQHHSAGWRGLDCCVRWVASTGGPSGWSPTCYCLASARSTTTISARRRV